jgi:hypothetical protein
MAGDRGDVPLEHGPHLIAAAGGLIDAGHERQEAAADLGDAGPDGLCLAAGSPTATQPIGIWTSGGTTQPMWTVPPSATLLARPICAPLCSSPPAPGSSVVPQGCRECAGSTLAGLLSSDNNERHTGEMCCKKLSAERSGRDVM